MKYKLITIIGLAGSTVVSLLGGWDASLQTLLVFMAVDWITGGILLPAVLGKARSSPMEHWKAAPGGRDCAARL